MAKFGRSCGISAVKKCVEGIAEVELPELSEATYVGIADVDLRDCSLATALDERLAALRVAAQVNLLKRHLEIFEKGLRGTTIATVVSGVHDNFLHGNPQQKGGRTRRSGRTILVPSLST